MKIQKYSDGELVGLTREGNEAAFAELVERYADRLTAILFGKLRNREDARDVTQEAFFIAYRDLEKLSPPDSFAAWLHGIARNLAHSRLYDRKKSRHYAATVSRDDIDQASPLAQVEDREIAQGVHAALAHLDDDTREIVILYYIREEKVEAIARLLGRPAGSIKRMLHNARSILKKELLTMAHEEFADYQLTEEQKTRLTKIADFPPREPKIVITPLEEEAPPIRVRSMYGTFPELRSGAESSHADYDHPSARLAHVTHSMVEGPIDVSGTAAFRINHLDFCTDHRPKWEWKPYVEIVNEDSYRILGFQCHKPGEEAGDISGQLEYTPESFLIEPGASWPKANEDLGGFVDANLFEVKIGRRTFRCIRRIRACLRKHAEWLDREVADCATEEFFLQSGRLLLWRRYNGEWWGKENPARKHAAPSGSYESLAEADLPSMELFGDIYYLWYDQVPQHALRD